MAAPSYCSVSAVFWEYLQHLALQDFPCGLGSWNKSCFDAHTSPRRNQPGQEEAVMLDEESYEVLIELLHDPRSPWALPPGCSSQDQYLRETAMLTPELVRGSNIFRVLRILRIVGKGVEEVDEGLLQLQKLEQLILSANQINRISSANLPRTLKVLELCCNAVGDLQDLCTQPPPELQHLGLGYNKLCGPLQDEYLTVDFWPNLVSLDLSFNSFTDLLELVSQLSSLQKLRILVLQGNPLALIPTYRGFLVDSLPKLSVLDDVHIEPDERHRFQGLAKQPELIRSEAQLVVSIGEIKGVPDPSTHQQPEVDSEAPVITYSYCVTYEFLEREKIGHSISTEETKIHQRPVVVTLDMDSSAQDTRKTMNQQQPTAKEEPKVPSAKVFVTPGKPWADTIDCSYRKVHTVKDLVGLKSFLEAGTIVSIVEEKVLLWPVSTDPEENTVKKGKAGQALQKGSAKAPVPRNKQKKKKEEKPCELHSHPPIQKTLGTGKVTLEALLTTEDVVATVCDFGILITEQPVQPPSLEEKDGKKGKSKSKKTKAEREIQTSRKTTASAEDEMHKEPQVPQPAHGKSENRPWSAVTHEATTQILVDVSESPVQSSPAAQPAALLKPLKRNLILLLAGKKKPKDSAELEEGRSLQPVPLTVQFQMQLLRWPMAVSSQSQESVGEPQ